ncbi:hypothetical protein LY78DRAFT_662760 [Colletotrichum sublineola]|nr:hypothetical protein LY78DRAFT_662760 [Colletotrichum sublineola]
MRAAVIFNMLSTTPDVTCCPLPTPLVDKNYGVETHRIVPYLSIWPHSLGLAHNAMPDRSKPPLPALSRHSVALPVNLEQRTRATTRTDRASESKQKRLGKSSSNSDAGRRLRGRWL